MASFSFTDFGSSGSDTTTYTDTLTVGAGGAERTFALVFAARANNGAATAVQSVTLGGKPATVVSDGVDNAFVSQVDVAGGPRNMCAMYRLSAADLDDPSATSLAMEIIWNGTALRCGWAIGATADAIEAVAHKVKTASIEKNGVASDETLDVSLNTAANAFVVAGCFVADTTAASASNAWTGATEPVGGDFQTGGENGRFGVAAESNVIAATPRTVSVTMTHAGNQFAPVALSASLAPAATGMASPLVGALGKPLSGLMGH